MDALQKLCAGLKNAQDQKTGMWCQVVDKCDEPGNWNETSGTGMFIYLLQRSIDKGYISESEYKPVVEKAYAGIVKKADQNKQGHIDLIECSSIGIQNSYADYISQPKEVSPFAAFGSFIIGTSIVEERSGFSQTIHLYLPTIRREKSLLFRPKGSLNGNTRLRIAMISGCCITETCFLIAVMELRK
jgi:hypothetical protein